MTAHTNDILEMLADDMVSHGSLVQYFENNKNAPMAIDEQIRLVLAELLSSDMVDVGMPAQVSPNYVEFVAWRGTTEQRIRRAFAAVDAAIGHDKLFAYWLCLRKNVDRFEE